MQTAEFLRKILPETGLYVAGRLTPKGFRNQVVGSIAELAQQVLMYDTQGAASYMAMAAYRAPFIMGVKDGKPIKQIRVQRNVRACKTYWMDLDVEPGNPAKYESQEAAIEGLVSFCQATGLPIPLCTNSGYGVHIYWVLREEISSDTWQTTAEGLKALAAKLNFKTDTSCTSDAARVLRPVGTYNRKDPHNPRPVALVADAEAIDPAEFQRLVADALKLHQITVPEVVPPGNGAGAAINQDFAVKKDFPPWSGTKVAERCQQLAVMRDTRGNMPEPAWFACIQLLCHSAEGEELIHQWSNGYAGYTAAETNRKIGQIRGQNIGPTLCATFESRSPGGCDGCPSKGQISTPAQLGALVVSVPAMPLNVPAATAPAVLAQPMLSSADQTPATHPLIDLNAQYAWVCQQKQIYRFRHSDFIDPRLFKIALANRPPVLVDAGANSTKSVALADMWLRWPDRRQHQDIVYEPGKDAIFKDCVNIWRGWGCEPAEGDIGPWKQLLDAAFGPECAGRSFFERWVAHQIQHAGQKLNTACVLWSTQQGVGKTLIGETIGRIFGENSATITAAELNGKYNPWARGKQFILGEENTSSKRREEADRLKHLITGDRITIDDKFQPAVSLRNTINFMFTSNSPNAFHLDTNDRRFFVWEFKGDKLPDDFFTEFVKWRDEHGGLAALMHYLLHLPLVGFNPKAAAPMTEAKESMIEASYSNIERWIVEHYTGPDAPAPSEIVHAEDLVTQYNSIYGPRLANQTSIGNALSRFGCGKKRRIRMPDGQRRQLRSIQRHKYWEFASDDAWVAEYARQFPIPAGRQTATVPQLGHS